MRNISSHLAPVLFECLTKQEENIYDDDWNTAKCASACLTLLSQTIRDEIGPIVIPFVGNYINNENWRFKEAATMALGCVLEGPGEASGMPKTLQQALPFLVQHMKDPSLLVQDTSTWVIGKICAHFPNIIEQNAYPVIEALIVGMNSPEQVIAVQACNVRLFLSFFTSII